ncbi:unnamed protein product [Caenorhabditis brenneri]
MIPKSGSFDGLPKNFRASLRRTNSEVGSDIFDYMDESISRSHSQYSGILTIAPPVSAKTSGDFGHLQAEFVNPTQPKNEEQVPLRRRVLGFLKSTLKIIPLMHQQKTPSTDSSGEGDKDLNQNSTKKEEVKKEEEEGKSARFQSKNSENKKKTSSQKMVDSDSAVYEIDELNSTIAPSSSRQCIVGADLECGVTIKKPKKKKAIQRTEFHPRPPFSCVPIYTAILLGLLIVLIVGAVTTIVDMRPAFIYGEAENSTLLHLNKTLKSIVEPPELISFSTLKPQ